VDLVQNAMRAWSAVDNHPSLREYLWLHLELTFEAAVVHDCNDVFSNVLFWPRNLIQMVGRFHVLEKEATQLITMWFQQCICKIFDYWTLCFFRTGLDTSSFHLTMNLNLNSQNYVFWGHFTSWWTPSASSLTCGALT
jgi:hypothetical protein